MTALLDFLSDWKTLASLGAALFGASAAILYVPGVKAFLLGTKYGRYIILAATIVLIVVVALVKARSLGRRDEQLKQQKQTVENERTRTEIDHDVANDSDADLERQLTRGLRDK